MAVFVSRNESSDRLLGALEACAGVVGRGFVSAEVEGRGVLIDALTPSVMELVGRSLIRQGEIVMLVDTTGGRLQILPCETWDVEGGPFPSSWEYRLTLGGPSRTLTYDWMPASSVLHFRYAPDAAKPWRGNSPLEVAALAGRLSSETVNALADESSGPVGSLLGIPKDGDDDTVTALKSDIKNARGRVALLESGDWDNTGGGNVDLETKPWRGNSPLEVAALAGRLSSETVNALADESSGPVGSLLGIPKDGDDDTVTALKSDIKNARGRVALLESDGLGQHRRRQRGP